MEFLVSDLGLLAIVGGKFPEPQNQICDMHEYLSGHSPACIDMPITLDSN